MKSGNAVRLLVLFALILFIPASGNLPRADAAQKRVTVGQLRDGIEKALAAKGLKNASVSILVKSLKDGSVIYENNPEQALMPASNLKLVTTATALEKLGKDYKYSTRFYLTASPDGNGVVNGSLIVKGSGDPNISGRGQGSVITLLGNAVQQLKAKGVQKITGGIVIDDTIFDRLYVNPDWPADQMDRWYQAEISGVSFNDNCLDLTLTPGDAVGEPARVAVSPMTGYITINNTCKTTDNAREHKFAVTRDGDSNTFSITGTIWTRAKPYKTSIPIHEPGLYFGTVFREVLEKGGIAVGGNVSLATKSYDEKNDGLVPGAELTSDIARTITVANQRSQNFYAESMLKLLGHSFGAAGSWAEGVKVIEGYLDGLSVSTDDYAIRDGSGLSKSNRLTARAIVTVLEHMRSGELAQIYMDSLAVSGLADTSLEQRLGKKPYAGKIHGKTGSLSVASALSGYAENLDGEIFAFSIIVNGTSNNAAEKLQDAICRLLVELQTSN